MNKDAFEAAGQALMERIAERGVAIPHFKNQTKQYREDLAFLIETYTAKNPTAA
jgi:hypothetical protein